jgi:predicted secreted protein
VKQFVLSQLHSIRTAIRDYPWQGAAAIRHAWARANFEWSARPNPHTAADRTLLQKAGGVLAKMVSIVATTAKLLSGTADASEDIAKLIDNAPMLTGGKGEQ